MLGYRWEMAIQSFRELVVWQKSFLLVKDIYKLAEKLPGSEKFGLINQVQRCAVSIRSNIAEGQRRRNVNEIYSLNVKPLVSELQEVQKMLYSVSKKL